MKINIQKSRKKIYAIIASLLVIILIATGGVVLSRADNKSTEGEYSSPSTTEKDKKNASDPTYSSEKASTTNPTGKTPDSGSTNAQSEKLNVSVGITSARVNIDVVEVRAFVSQIIEAGTCTATFTKEGSSTITASSNAFIDATTTQCDIISAPLSSFESGSWKVSVSYLSSDAVGDSSAFEVSIP